MMKMLKTVSLILVFLLGFTVTANAQSRLQFDDLAGFKAITFFGSDIDSDSGTCFMQIIQLTKFPFSEMY